MTPDLLPSDALTQSASVLDQHVGQRVQLSEGGTEPDQGLRDLRRGLTVIEYDRLFWSAAEHRIAAAVVGSEARHLVLCIGTLSASPTFLSGDYARGMLSADEAVAIDLARRAVHYAICALELEERELERGAA